MKADKNLIEWLLNESDLSKYAISKATGIHITTLTNLSDGKSLIENLSFKNAAALTEYAEEIMKEEGTMKTWKRNGYTVEERAHDYSLHKFVITVDGEDMGEIVPDSIKDMQEVISQLDEGEEAVGMADGQGGEVELPIYMIETEDPEAAKRGGYDIRPYDKTYSEKQAWETYKYLTTDKGLNIILTKVHVDGYNECLAERVQE